MDLRRVLLAIGFLALGTGRAGAQVEIRNFQEPILVVETEGHHAPLRSLIWRDSSTLLSGGLDKVVKVWELRDGPRLLRTLRPPIWRGTAGIIYAMALTPRPDAQGQSLLAVAGYGVESRRGDITIFRIPGLERSPTGEVARRIVPNGAQAVGHEAGVLCLAFDPSGQVLASGSLDQTVILWDVPDFGRPRVLKGHTGDVRTLAFSPDGRRLATAGEDGAVRLWDVKTGAQLEVRELAGRNRSAINSVAFSPDGLYLVAGREDGALVRFDARANSRVAPVMLPTVPSQGPVEALDYSPKGTQLVVSIKSDRTERNTTLDPSKVTCDVEVRDMPGGAVKLRRKVLGLVQSCKFSPDGALVAYSGGVAQAIAIQDAGVLGASPLEVKGQGTTIFDLGFTEDNQAIGFNRGPSAPGDAPQDFDGFDMARRQYRRVSRDELRRAIKQYNGWTLRENIPQYRLDVVHTDGRRFNLELDQGLERYWWSTTFIPPGPGHPRATVAVGCESGVVIYDLESGRRTRALAGHSSAVVSVVPSPDGRWLASGSIDQTIMIYPLAGCDTRPGFGATFRQRADGRWEVATVKPKSFAASIDLQGGDVIVKAGIAFRRTTNRYYQSAREIGEFTTQLDDLIPNLDLIGIYVRRTVRDPVEGNVERDLPAKPASKRDDPAMTLLLDVDREWVLWTPQGHYDTSIAGDTRLLGWQLNPPFDQARPADFVPISTYAATMYRPAVLEQLWQAGGVADVPPPKNPDEPPLIALSAIAGAVKMPAHGVEWAVSDPNPTIHVSISSQGTSKVGDRKVYFDEAVLPTAGIAAPVDRLQEDHKVRLTPGRSVRFLVRAANVDGLSREEFVDLVYRPRGRDTTDPPQPPRPRGVVLSIGNERSFDPKVLPPVRFSERDAQSLAEFLPGRLLAAGGEAKAQDPAARVVLTGGEASEASITGAFEQLRKSLESKQLRQGDIVAIVLATHVLEFDKATIVTAADFSPGQPPGGGISAREVSERLGELTDYGCRVVLFLDGVHDLSEGPFSADIKSWVRDLWMNRRVITFVASKEGPSGFDVTGRHRYFALGVLRAFQQVQDPNPQPYSLERFKTAVIREVLNLSGRRQEVGCYVPQAVAPGVRFAMP